MIKKTTISILSASLITSVAFAGNFDGFYGGIYTGYAKAQSNITEYTAAGIVDGYTGDISPDDFLYGGVLGYDWNLADNLIVGLAFDYESRNSNKTTEYQKLNGTVAPIFSFASKVNSTYSLRSRLGYILNKKSLVYLTAGITKADIEFSIINNITSVVDSYKKSHSGYNVGLGTNYDLGNNFQLFGEYRYSDYGLEHFTATITGPSTYQFDQDVTEHAIRIGIVYKF